MENEEEPPILHYQFSIAADGAGVGMSIDGMQVRDAVQDVPPGYKRTEVGVIPEDWDASSVGAEFVIQLGKMLDAEKNVGELKPYIGNRAVQWGRIDLEELSTVPMTSSDIQRFRLREGDLLVCEGGEIGRAAIWEGALPECYYQKALHRLRPIRGYDVYLMLSFFELWAATGYMSNYVTQTSIAHLPKDKLETIPLPCPPAIEQRAIAEALSDVDSLLGALEALIAKKRAIKQAAMQQLLTGKTRLPGFSGEWAQTKLRDLVSADRFAIVDGPFGSQLKVSEYVKSGVPLIEMEHLSDEIIADSPNRFIRPEKFNELKRSAVYPGDILVSKTGSLGKLGMVPDWIEKALITSRLAKITLNPSRANCGFVFQCLLNLRAGGYWETVSQGGTMQILGIGMLSNAPIPKISVAEQNAIATVLSDMDAAIAALEARRDKTRAIKQGMMQQLLTGRVRLVESL